MDILLIVAFIAVLGVLCVTMVLCSFLLYIFIQLMPDEPKPTSKESQDIYTPDSADTTVPLDQFNPNFKKPLKVVIKDENDQTIMEEVADEG